MKRFGFNFSKLGMWNIALGIFLIFLLIFFVIRATDEDRWSDWGFGDAQTILSLRQWEEGGWIANKFLFVPQGYAKVVQEMFDEPELSHHAHGICPGVSKTVGPKLRYTHYPAGYLVPYAFLFRLGIDKMFYMRLLSILLSFGALVLMYMVFSRITSRAVSFFAVFFYGLTPTFLGFADTLANQPIDDLLRFAFMFAIVLSTRSESAKHRRIWMFSAWIFEFMLSLSSFDSVFFIYFWLIGWDILDGQGFRWKRYLIYALAPVSAHSLQFLQNIWYLGFDNAIVDIKDTFLQKSGAEEGHGPIFMRWVSLMILFDNLYNPSWLIVIMFILYAVYAIFLKGKADSELPSVKLLTVLFFCGLVFLVILPHGARMPYEARQMIPFASLLIGGVSWSFLKEFKNAVYSIGDNIDEKGYVIRKRLKVPYLLLSSVMLLVFWYLFIFNERKPVYEIPENQVEMGMAGDAYSMSRAVWNNNLLSDVLFAKEINESLFAIYEPVLFDVGGFQIFWDPTYVPGYPQINPLMEYYAGSKPILCFDEPGLLAADIIYMVRKSPYKFSPVLISRDQAALERVLSVLQENGILKQWPPNFHYVMGRFVLDITGYLNWDAGGNKNN